MLYREKATGASTLLSNLIPFVWVASDRFSIGSRLSQKYWHALFFPHAFNFTVEDHRYDSIDWRSGTVNSANGHTGLGVLLIG